MDGIPGDDQGRRMHTYVIPERFCDSLPDREPMAKVGQTRGAAMWGPGDAGPAPQLCESLIDG